MARRKKKTEASEYFLAPEEPKTEWQKFLVHLEENIKLYVAGTLFIILCLAIGGLLRMSAAVKDKNIMTEYAEIVMEEDAGKRLAKYEELSPKAGRWTAEVLYRQGETALEIGDFSTAKEAFNAVLKDHGKSEFAPSALDGLAFALNEEGKLQEALDAYDRLTQEWPSAFVSRRAFLAKGALLEKLDRPAEAVAAYQHQRDLFPDSSSGRNAETAMNTLLEKHPELKPAESADAGMPSPEESVSTEVLSTSNNESAAE